MTCSDARQRMERYIAGRLSTADAERLEGHICSCALCEAEIEGLLGALPAGMLNVPSPVGLREEILATVVAQPASMSDECYILAPQLSAFVDDELDAEERAVVERHTASCSTCARQLRSLVGVHELVRSLPAFEPSSRLSSRILASIPSPQRPSVWSRITAALRWRPVQVGLPVAVTAALALVATVPFWRPPQPGEAPNGVGTSVVGHSTVAPVVQPERAIPTPEVTVTPEATRVEVVRVSQEISDHTRAIRRPSVAKTVSAGITPRSVVGPSSSEAAVATEPTPALPTVLAGTPGSAVYHLVSAGLPERLADEPRGLVVPKEMNPSPIRTISRTPAREPEDMPSGDVVLALDVTSDWQSAPTQNIVPPAGVYSYN